MGGKKGAQRTKNNAKPSSSGRTAELLTANPTQITSFSSLKGTHFPTSSVSAPLFDVFDPQIDPNLLVVLKKLSKKDGTTRFKALNELTQLVKECDDTAVINLLPYWVKLYTNLVVDVEHKVREATQTAHRSIATRVGRNLAPHVKQIVPSWFISQCDTHPPAASAAGLAFQEAFPPHKIVDVIVFCQSEIVKYITDNLLSEKNIPKNDEEAEAKSERITVACLNGYSLYLSRIPSQNLEAVLEDNVNIVSSPLFWKLQRHKSRNVRAAFFSLLSSMLKNSPSLIEKEHKRLANSILSTLDDYDPVVLPCVWESVLHLITVVSDCWQHVNLDKLVLNKICSIIGQGGHGSAHFIFPNILLLLSKIPNDIIKSKLQFYSRIFASFLQGMKQQSVIQSQSESDAISTSFHECVRYIIMSNLEDHELCTTIIKDHVLTSYSHLMLDASFKHLIAPYYSAFVQNLLYWQRNSQANPAYATHLNSLCGSLPTVVIRNLNKMCEDRSKIAFIHECEVKLIDALNHPNVKKRKNLRVQFSLDESSTTRAPASDVPAEDAVDSHEEALRDKFYPLVDELIKKHFTVACNHESNEVKAMNVEQLWRLTSVCNPSHLSKLTEAYSVDLYPALTDWLRCEYIPVNCILGLIFNTIENVEEARRATVLSQLTEIRPDESVLEVIKMASQEMSGKKTFKKWLESTKVRTEVLKTLEDRIEAGNNCVHLLEMCWSTYKSGEPVLGAETVITLMEILTKNLESGKVSHSMIRELIESLIVERNYCIVTICGPKVLYLLKSLFVIILTNYDSEVALCWKKAVRLVFSLEWDDRTLLQDHARECIKIVPELLRTWDVSSVTNVERAVGLMYFMAVVSIERNDSSTTGWSSIFLEDLMNDEWNTQLSLINDLVQKADLISGITIAKTFTSSSAIKVGGFWDPICGIELTNFARSTTLCTKYLVRALCSDSAEESEDSDYDYDLSREKISSSLPKVDYMMTLTHALILCKNSWSYFQTTKQCEGLLEFTTAIEADLKELIQRLIPSEQQILVEHSKRRAEENEGQTGWRSTYEYIVVNFLDLELKIEEHVFPEEFEISADFLYRVRTQAANDDYLGRILSMIVNTYQKSNYSAFEKGLSSISPEHLVLNAEIARFLEMMVKRHVGIIEEVKGGWDFIMIATASWFISNSLTNVETVVSYLDYTVFMDATCSLLLAFVEHFKESDVASKATLYDEWCNLFANETYVILLTAWSNLAEQTLSANVLPEGLLHLNTLCKTICQLNEWGIPAAPYLNLDNILPRLMDVAMKTIISPHIPVQVTTYLVLVRAVPQLVKKDENFDENSLKKLSCQCCLPTFTTAQSIVTALLRDFSLGVSCVVRPHTDGFTYTLGYLMFWCWLLEMCRRCDSQLRYVYTLWIKESNLMPHIIESVFKLMPESVLRLGESGIKKKQEFFLARPALSLDAWTSDKLSQFSCWLYCELLRILPAVARQWTAEADPKFLSFVDKLTSIYVSPILCNEEMNSIKDEQKAFDNVEVQTHSAVREVIAVYTVEETSTELIIKLAANHPLSPPKVEISKAIKISSNQNRQLLMQLTIFLTHQNGSIWDGLLLWKSNLDKKFEGVEECYICFSIVHQSSHQLPKMTCQTCKKKFHSFCLYKWFTTSNMSTCPICRNHF